MGFTMIELIFVIVILGVLAAVALPKFTGVSEQALFQKCNAAVGSMNRTVGPTLWSRSIKDKKNGSIKSYAAEVESTYMKWPEDCGGAGTMDGVVSGTDTTINLSGTTYDLKMVDGNNDTSPKFTLTK